VPFSRADISKAARLLGYRPQFPLEQGLERTVDWYLQSLQPQTEERKAAYA
jgi:nucleoside-diphosphate-sugar epimerase